MISSSTENHATTDFNFDLPESLIAQKPSQQRDHSRLLSLNRASGHVTHGIFTDIDTCLHSGDLLIVNNTKVFPCRIPATGPGGGKAEIFLLHEEGLNCWNALVKGSGRVGKRLRITDRIEAEIIGLHDDCFKTVRFHGVDDVRSLLSEIGKTPLPPYIRHEADTVDRERYQTVFAVHEGAVAAPTAGLHFTEELLQRLTTKGIEIAAVTLHVGLGTFQPVRVQSIREHRMLPERYLITDEAAQRINNAKAEGRRVIAVGTTTVRTIETAAAGCDRVAPGDGSSELFIFPGYPFTVTDGIVTNFHLPKSTLLMLVSAFAGRERVLSAYRTAIAAKYRFYSYGDAMMIL